MDIFWIILAVIVIALLCVAFYYMGKHKWVGKLIFSILGLIFVGFSIYCATDLNYYYTAKGGIYGVLNGLFNVNTVEGEGLEFSLQNIELKQVEDDHYSASVKIDRVIDFEQDIKYIVCVNGVPCSSSEVKQNYAQATYEYKFYNQDLSLKLKDTLTFSFAFYSNYTMLTVSTNGGTDAVKQWNSYFNKNNFVVSIEESQIESNITMNNVEGDISNFRTITYYVEDEIYDSVYFDSTKIINWINRVPIKENFTFIGWSLDGENVVKNIKATKDIEVYAVFTEGGVLFSGEKEIFIGDTYRSNYTLDLNEFFDNLAGRNISVILDAHITTPLNEQADVKNVTLDQLESANLICSYEENLSATIKLVNQSILISPSNYASGYFYTIKIHQIIAHT